MNPLRRSGKSKRTVRDGNNPANQETDDAVAD
jgi:hypothetical protein